MNQPGSNLTVGHALQVDFAHYKQVLKNQEVVSQMEKTFTGFKPVDYDLSAQLKAIDAFQDKAVSSAQETVSKIDSELKDLNATLSNIKDARGFEELTLQDVAKARPQIPQTVDTMLEKGKWTVPGYKEKFGDLSLFYSNADVEGARADICILQTLCKSEPPTDIHTTMQIVLIRNAWLYVFDPVRRYYLPPSERRALSRTRSWC